MGFSYTAGSTATRDRIRLLIGDTIRDTIKFEDEEIDDFITQKTSLYGSAAEACKSLALRYAAQFDFSADGSSFKRSSMSERYEALGARLERLDEGTTVVMPTRQDGYSDDISSEEATIGDFADFDSWYRP